MTFTGAALIIVAFIAVALGLACHHLLNRLDLLERSVAGGLAPPSRRLGREEYELRFATALLRSRLAAHVGTGLVIAVDPDVDDEVVSTLNGLQHTDGVFVAARDRTAVDRIDRILDHQFTTLALDTFELDPPTLPHLWIVDEARVVAAMPIAGATDLVHALRTHT